MIPAMLPVHRMNHALFLTATALVTRRRVLRLRHHRLQWVDTAEKAQRSLLRGGTATRTNLVLETCCIVVFVVFFLNYLRHVSLVQNLFTVVATGFAMQCMSDVCFINVVL